MKKGQGSGKHGQTTFAIERFRYMKVFFSRIFNYYLLGVRYIKHFVI